jgi:hypothetical protein
MQVDEAGDDNEAGREEMDEVEMFLREENPSILATRKRAKLPDYPAKTNNGFSAQGGSLVKESPEDVSTK